MNLRTSSALLNIQPPLGAGRAVRRRSVARPELHGTLCGSSFPRVSRLFHRCYDGPAGSGRVATRRYARGRPRCRPRRPLAWYRGRRRARLGSWLEPQRPQSGAPAAYPGQRLGLPAEGPRSLARFGRRLVALVVDWVIALLIAGGLLRQRPPRRSSGRCSCCSSRTPLLVGLPAPPSGTACWACASRPLGRVAPGPVGADPVGPALPRHPAAGLGRRPPRPARPLGGHPGGADLTARQLATISTPPWRDSSAWQVAQRPDLLDPALLVRPDTRLGVPDGRLGQLGVDPAGRGRAMSRTPRTWRR